jgi:molybdopterin converting factor subunit 1
VESFVRLLAFAGARDVVGEPEVRLAVPSTCTVAQLFDRIVVAYPGLDPYRGCLRLAVNGTYANADDVVSAGDEVALIPPVAGG